MTHDAAPPARASQESAHPPSLMVDGVTALHGHGARARQTLAATSLDVLPGESVAVVGRSGAGKSTLADIVLGLRPPAAGAVTACGEHWCSPTHTPAKRLRSLVQGVPQDPIAAFVPRWTIRRSITRAVRGLDGGADPEASIAHAAELAHLDPALLDKRPTEMSGGQMQRAAIARALAVNPRVLVADEPTSALDPQTAAAVATALLAIVEGSDIALLVVTHDPEFATRCTRTVEITPPEQRSL